MVTLVTFGVLGAALYVLLRRKARAELAKLAAELGVPAASPLVVVRGNRTLSVTWAAGKKKQPPRLRISANVDEAPVAEPVAAYRTSGRERVDVRPAFVLRREHWVDRLGERIGLNRRIRTGDAPFDQAVFIETRSPEADVKRALADEALRGAVRSLLEEGAEAVVLDPKGLTAVCPYAPVGSRAALFERGAAPLSRAAPLIPVFSAGRAASPGNRLQAAAPIVALLGVFAGRFLDGPAPYGPHASFIGIGGGLALSVLIAAALVFFMRGHSDSVRRVAAFSFAALLLVPSIAYSTVCNVNSRLDTSPPAVHSARVVGKDVRHHKNGATYSLDLVSWRPGEQATRIEVTSRLYLGTSIGDRIDVTTRAGRLGWEWIQLVSPAGKCR
jgi:hypothetical protein